MISSSPSSTRPNVVFIMADDMGYGDFGIFSEGRCNTPALDQLTRESLCLTQHYSAAPVCTPARAGFLTGKYPHRTGAIDMRESRGLERISLRESTIADHFKAAGYRTGLIGKWHNGTVGEKYHPNARGFDEFIGFKHGLISYYDWKLERNGQPMKADGRYLTDVLTEEAIGFIDRHAKEPFFLFLAYNAPHTPLEVPDEEAKPYRDTGKFSDPVSKVYGMVSRMDKGIERVLNQIKKAGLDNHTLVCFTSDNGPSFAEGMARFNCGFNGSKMQVYEGGIRVPMILRWPGFLPANSSYHSLVHFCDWMPTLMSAAGMTPSPDLNLDGHNILPALQGDTNALSPKRFWQWNRYAPEITCNAAMRDGPWKLVRPQINIAMQTSHEEMAIDRRLLEDPGSFDPKWLTAPFPERTLPQPVPPELYHLEEDPCEKNNLSGQYPDQARKMLCELETWFESVEKDRISSTAIPA